MVTKYCVLARFDGKQHWVPHAMFGVTENFKKREGSAADAGNYSIRWIERGLLREVKVATGHSGIPLRRTDDTVFPVQPGSLLQNGVAPLK